MERFYQRTGLLSLALLSLASLAAPCAIAKDKNPEHDPELIGNRDVGKGVNFYSIEREIGLGKEMALETERQAKMVDDSVVTEYVNRLVQTVANNSDTKERFTIRVGEPGEVNACALPGGARFVNTGLFPKADTEAEPAGVLAHEIAHVAE